MQAMVLQLRLVDLAWAEIDVVSSLGSWAVGFYLALRILREPPKLSLAIPAQRCHRMLLRRPAEGWPP